MDILARAPLKGAAKRDSLCELQNSVNRWPPERALRSRDFLRAGLLQCLALSTCACKQHVYTAASLSNKSSIAFVFVNGLFAAWPMRQA